MSEYVIIIGLSCFSSFMLVILPCDLNAIELDVW